MRALQLNQRILDPAYSISDWHRFACPPALSPEPLPPSPCLDRESHHAHDTAGACTRNHLDRELIEIQTPARRCVTQRPFLRKLGRFISLEFTWTCGHLFSRPDSRSCPNVTWRRSTRDGGQQKPRSSPARSCPGLERALVLSRNLRVSPATTRDDKFKRLISAEFSLLGADDLRYSVLLPPRGRQRERESQHENRSSARPATSRPSAGRISSGSLRGHHGGYF